MAHRSPPFAALRALEAACRHRSYSAAAAELDITHSAISQAVRRLEEEVGAKLFVRRGAAMEPTGSSLALAAAYAEAAGLVGRALRHASDQSPNSLTLKAPVQIARLWLTPLLSDLALQFPTVSLCLRTDHGGDAECDIAIQAQPPRPGFEAQALMANPGLKAYASPALLRRLVLDTPAALLAGPLLIERDGADWAAWFEAAGVACETALPGLRFDDETGLALDAAIRGAGVALGDTLSVQAALNQGELAPVFGQVALERHPLWTSWRADHPKADLIEPLVDWLSKQTGAHPTTVVTPLPPLARLSA